MGEKIKGLSLNALWQGLTQPHHSIQEPEQRRRAQLLSQLLLVLIPLGVISTIGTGIANANRDPMAQFSFIATSIVAIIAMVIAYWISRTKFYGIGAFIVLSMIYFTTVGLMTIITPGQTSFLPYLTMVILLSSMLFSLRYTFLFAGLGAVGILFLPQLVPGFSSTTVSNELVYLLMMAALIFVSVRQRDLIESDRRAIRLEIELALGHERDLINTLMNTIPDAIYYKDTEGRFVRINAAQAGFLGIADKQDAIGKNDFDFFSPSHSRQTWEDEQKILSTNAPMLDKLEHFITPSGEDVWVSVTKVPLFDNNGKILGIVGVSRDTTERRKVDEALRNSEERLRSLITSMDDLIFSLDLNGHFLFYHQPNPPAGDTPITTETHYVGISVERVLPLEVSQQLRQVIVDVTNTLSPQSLDYSVRDDDKESYFSARVSPLINAALKLIGVTVVARDVTEAVQAKQREERSQKLAQLNQTVSTLFLESDDYSEVINGILQIIGTGLDVSTVHVFQFHDDTRLMDNTHEWDMTGIKPVMNSLQGIDVDQITPSLIPLLTTGIIVATHLDELPVEIRNILKAQSYQSILALSFYVDNRIQGFIGLGEKRHTRQWLPEEIVALHTISESLARVLERQRAQIALIEARDTALRSAQLRSEFVSNMSHEVRTPMTGVLGMLELLRETELDSDQREFADTAFSSGHNLLHILDDILDFSKIEAGRMTLEEKLVSLSEIVNEVSATLSAQVAKKKLNVTIAIASDVPERVFTDPTRLRQVLLNLFSNALKFTQQGSVGIGIRQVSAAHGRSRLRFEVSDTGIGIKPEHLTHIFDSFVQADGTTTRRYGGTGLGLAISQQLVQLMGGQIDVQSVVGVGSSFGFTLTLRIADAIHDEPSLVYLSRLHLLVVDEQKPARYALVQQLGLWSTTVSELASADKLQEFLSQAIRTDHAVDIVFFRSNLSPDEQENIAVAIHDEFNTQAPRLVRLVEAFTPFNPNNSAFYAQLTRPLHTSDLYDLLINIETVGLEDDHAPLEVAPTPTNGPIRLLLADDNTTNQQMVMRMLSLDNVEIDIANDGREALKLLEKNSYNLILMDIHMPHLDGLATTRRIRALPGPVSNIPVIALTASVLVEEKQLYLEAGMNGMLSKPFTVKQLRSCVQQWITPTAITYSAT